MDLEETKSRCLQRTIYVRLYISMIITTCAQILRHSLECGRVNKKNPSVALKMSKASRDSKNFSPKGIWDEYDKNYDDNTSISD